MLYSSQPATLNYLTTAADLDLVVGTHCVDTLVEYDNKGVMREGLATKLGLGCGHPDLDVPPA